MSKPIQQLQRRTVKKKRFLTCTKPFLLQDIRHKTNQCKKTLLWQKLIFTRYHLMQCLVMISCHSTDCTHFVNETRYKLGNSVSNFIHFKFIKTAFSIITITFCNTAPQKQPQTISHRLPCKPSDSNVYFCTCIKYICKNSLAKVGSYVSATK